MARLDAEHPASRRFSVHEDGGGNGIRRSGREVAVTPWSQRWYGRLVLLSISVALLTLAYAPIKQFYLAWVGLVPWLVVIARCRSYKSAILWGWLSGWLFFLGEHVVMKYVTLPGGLALMALLGGYWGLMGAVVRRAWGHRSTASGERLIWLIPFAWTALDLFAVTSSGTVCRGYTLGIHKRRSCRCAKSRTSLACTASRSGRC